mmetsp:Transcript_950/g.1853  ORF Transcript_950/g.1853 Transcript_950/m.1853 type:complete len:527 (-) Transcript_950:151-1731(-)|eukprot:CAMPEP_0113621966 /NCGR_PEP_ID=MMETSP0017_2-20120614/11244_1 /TAXON_ID=2856 /ORGANISM="Cylindrotheca closterium" /LENGTH=526 /DNA_ID=CAMNT_0000531761 /DNA_START=163 /DNA_END=1743 /DNA_ORIENTATION=+ /assembly_acc=CAM_ASM_000147
MSEEEDIDKARRRQMGIIAEDEIGSLVDRSRLKILDDVLALDWDDIALGSTIGYGGFSQVFRVGIEVTSDAQGTTIADKEFALKCLSPNTMARTKSFKTGAVDLVIEATILCRLSHPNVIKLHGYYGNSIKTSYLDSERGYFIVIDLLADTLRNKIDKYRLQNPKMRKTSRAAAASTKDINNLHRGMSIKDSHKPNSSEALERIKSIGVDVAKGMEYLHSQGVVLRDLKPDNVGFDHQGVPKIFDLGFAREFHTLKPKEVAGSLRYMAPEIALGQPTEFASDVYSFGVLLWEMTTLEKPYKHIHDRDEFIESIMINGWRPSSSQMPSTALRKLVKQCWDAEHTRRPNFSKVVKILKVETSLVATNSKRGSGMPLPRTTTFSDTSAITRKNSLGKMSSLSKKTGNSFRALMGFGKKNSNNSIGELTKKTDAATISESTANTSSTNTATTTGTTSSSLQSMNTQGNKNASFGAAGGGKTKVNPLLAQALLGPSGSKKKMGLGKKARDKKKGSLYRAQSNVSMPNFFEE